ncbi:MAG: hypothetical protein ACJAQ1_000980 [Flavobacterium sp.]|jgi:hypothetical protein
MNKNFVFLFFFFCLSKSFQAQIQLSVYSEVSIITAGPGSQLYEAFGHSAIRIKDPVLNLDLIYNYGVFDFNTPNFNLNFAKGNLIYSLSRYDFKYFLGNYKKDNRWLKQQVLNISQQERQEFFIYLENNAQLENKNYSYDPYFNNCASILRDITQTILNNKIDFGVNPTQKNQTFRQLTNNELHWNAWGTFGLNLIAGIKLDQEATLEEEMYLPDYVYNTFKEAKLFVKNEPQDLIKKERLLLDFPEKKQASTVFSPFLIFSIIAIIGIFITLIDHKNNKRSKYIDFSLFFITGIIGVVLLFLWFFSSHSTAPNNFNVLWAFAPNLVVAFILLKENLPKWIKTYTQVLLGFLLIAMGIWIFKIQVLPLVILPLFVLFIIRYLFLSRQVIK